MAGQGMDRGRQNAALTAAIVGGAAAAATAGALWSARAIARRNGAGDGRPLNPVMKTAATACELAHSPAACAERDDGPGPHRP